MPPARVPAALAACLLAARTAHADDAVEEVRVRGASDRRAPAGQAVGVAEARRTPGAAGDAAKVVESMPGVARPALGSGDLVVWGAPPRDTRIYFGDVRLPRLFHDGGYRSVVPTEAVRAVELAPAAYGTPWGGGLGGVVLVAPRALDTDGAHAGAGADLLDVDAHARGAAGPVAAFAAARRSHLADLFAAAGREDVGQLFPLPRWVDGQVSVAWDASARERVTAGALGAWDATARGVVRADPSESRTERREAAFGRAWVRYERRLAGGSVVAITPWIGRDVAREAARFGSMPVELEIETTTYAVRASHRGDLAGWARAGVGLDGELAVADVGRRGSLAAPPREGDPRVFGRAPSGGIGADEHRAHTAQLAPWAEVDLALGADVEATLGVRLAAWIAIASRRTPKIGDTPPLGALAAEAFPEPRAAIRWRIARRLTAKAAFGATSQAAAPEDLSAVFGAPTLGPARAAQGLAGLEVELRAGVGLEVVAFASAFDGVAVRAPTDAPQLAAALVPAGSGRTFGAQTVLRARRLGPLAGWLAYTASRAERRDAPDGALRPSDYDQAHVLALVATCDLGAGFELGVRARAASGARRTRVSGSYFDLQRGAWEPTFDAANRDRLPAYVALDARAAKHLAVGPGTLEVYVEVQNVTNHTNAEDFVYSADYARRGVLAGMPVLPLAGARWSF